MSVMNVSLDWVEMRGPYGSRYWAKTPFGVVWIEEDVDEWTFRTPWATDEDDDFSDELPYFSSLEEAKSAALRDYRVRLDIARRPFP